jgi:hypothetical protein
MVVITLIVGSVGLFVAGFAALYTLWHLRLASRLERVQVRSGRPLPVLHEGVELRRDPE